MWEDTGRILKMTPTLGSEVDRSATLYAECPKIGYGRYFRKVGLAVDLLIEVE